MSLRSTLRRWLGFVEPKADPEVQKAVEAYEQELERFKQATEDIKHRPRGEAPSLDDLRRQVEQSETMMEEALRPRKPPRG